MFCDQCAKLAYLESKRICVRCQGSILNNISCICDGCSKDQNICSVCLKKLNTNQKPKTITFGGGCKSCGR